MSARQVEGPGSCLDCWAWGVSGRQGWRCEECRWWKDHYPVGECWSCRRVAVVGKRGTCRSCLEQARMLAAPGRGPDLSVATCYGQQLHLAIRRSRRRADDRPKVESRPTGRRRLGAPGPPVFRALTWRQLALFRAEPDPGGVRARALSADGELIRHCSAVARAHADRHGWSNRQTNAVINSLRILHVLQDTPGTRVSATEVQQLPRYGGTVQSTLEVLAAAGVLEDDRTPPLHRYFTERTVGLPHGMKGQVELWWQVVTQGSRTPPRRRARDPRTAHGYILVIAPILHTWARDGHECLTGITGEQVRAALPAGGSFRPVAEAALRSLFGLLKGRRLIFHDPTRGMPATPVNATIPLPLDTRAIRAALDCPDPAVALAVALVAFHALSLAQIQRLQLTDIVDGRLALPGRSIPLAGPVRTRLRAWLDHRARTWPHSINPHLFIGRRNAPRLGPASTHYLWRKTEVRPRALRQDRILHEIHAGGGDLRRICDLFGLSVDAATRYTATLAHPDLQHAAQVPPNPTST